MRLAPLTAAPTSVLLAEVEACRRDIARQPRVSPQRQARESAGGAASCLAADSVRDEPGAWWRFVLAALDATGFPTVKLYEHPESLRPLLDKLRTDKVFVLYLHGRSKHKESLASFEAISPGGHQ